jgi:hypothetical protein
MLKKIGEITVPWGTPHLIVFKELIVLFILTHCFLFDKWEVNNFKLLPQMPNCFNLIMRMSWSTVSKALVRSKYTVAHFFIVI